MNNNHPSLPFFPVPKTGETVFSLVDRCLVRSGIKETHLLMELTDQRRKTSLQSALPGYLTRLAKRMPHGHPWRDAATIVRAHTSLPYFVYFDCGRDRDYWLGKLASPDPSQPLAMALGLTSYYCGANPKHPQYCPTCAEEDDAAIGFSYFRREHQLPGVVVCWRHKTVLARGCQHCGPYPIKGSAASMAGKCLCCDGIIPLQAHVNLPDNMEVLHWLACQSAFMVKSGGTRHTNIRATLRANALEQGYGRGVLLDPSRLAEAIENRFGREVLEWLGWPVLLNGRPTSWMRRILSGQLDGKKRSPAILFLLLIGTLFESVESFEKTVERQGEAKVISGSTPQMKVVQESTRPAWSEQLFHLIHEGDCGLPGISKHMAVPVCQLIEEIHQRGWRVPLPQHIQKKLGAATIVAIQDDLRRGANKTEIMLRHGCSAWALTLIGLDESGLNAVYKNASKLNTQERNRERLRQYLVTNPAAARTDIMNDLPGVYDYLISRDKAWFYKQIPEKKVATQTVKRTNRVDWSLLDQQKAVQINETFDEIWVPGLKPVWVSASSALKQIDLLKQYGRDRSRFPLVAKILQKRAETRSGFILRRLEWAIEQMKTEQTPVSVNKLHRVADLPAKTVRDHKQEVIELARKLNAEIDGKSFFA